MSSQKVAASNSEAVVPTGKTSAEPGLSSSKTWLKPWKYLGFSKGYNVPLFIIFGGALLGFCLAKLPCLDVGGYWASTIAPGEWYWYKGGRFRIGITLHLATVLPAGILLVFQFVPVIRRKMMIVHRISGYIILTLIVFINASGLMIVQHAFGGDLATQGAVGMLAIITTCSAALAWYNIRMLQIDQHRAWMLRTAFYLGVIVTTRLIMIISAQVITKVGTYKVLMTCGELLSMQDATYVYDNYPLCATINSTSQEALDSRSVAVDANFGANVQGVGASLRLTFGMALWFAIFLHGMGVEIYLSLTPRETQRLRQASYQRQLKAGFSNPGSAGLVVEKFGDANPWQKGINS